MADGGWQGTPLHTSTAAATVEPSSRRSPKLLRQLPFTVFHSLLPSFIVALLCVQVARPKMVETTALGSAVAAGLAVGVWRGVNDPRLAQMVRAASTHLE